MVRRGPILCVMALLSLSAVINLGFYMSVTQKISFPSSDAKGYIFTDVGQLWKYGQTVKNATANNVNSLLKYGGNVRDATAGKVHEILKQGGIADNPTVKKIYEQLLKSSRVVHHTTMNKIYDLYNQFKSKLWQEEGGNIAGKDFETDIKDEFVEMVQNLTRLDLALEDDEDEAAIENSTFSLDDIADQPNGSTRASPVPQLEPIITDVVQPYYRLSLNIARYWNESQIVYNRVDGCGSRTLLAIIGILSYEHDYHSIWSRVWTAYNVSESRQRSLARVISKQPQPYIFNRHLYYIDFAKFGVEQLRYINLIREPLPRFMSGYNSKTSDNSKDAVDPEEGYHSNEAGLEEALKDCLLKGDPKCSQESAFQIIPYFCGQEPECRSPSRWALERAKRHVTEKYIFVGILEDFEDSLRVFELLLPQFFEGALKVYKTMISGLKKYEDFQVDTDFKSDVTSVDTLAEMSARLSLEYEFYNFVRTRMEIIKTQLQIE